MLLKQYDVMQVSPWNRIASPEAVSHKFGYLILTRVILESNVQRVAFECGVEST